LFSSLLCFYDGFFTHWYFNWDDPVSLFSAIYADWKIKDYSLNYSINKKTPG